MRKRGQNVCERFSSCFGAPFAERVAVTAGMLAVVDINDIIMNSFLVTETAAVIAFVVGAKTIITVVARSFIDGWKPQRRRRRSFVTAVNKSQARSMIGTMTICYWLPTSLAKLSIE